MAKPPKLADEVFFENAFQNCAKLLASLVISTSFLPKRTTWDN